MRWSPRPITLRRSTKRLRVLDAADVLFAVSCVVSMSKSRLTSASENGSTAKSIDGCLICGVVRASPSGVTCIVSEGRARPSGAGIAHSGVSP